jgi:hypothetical protein
MPAPRHDKAMLVDVQVIVTLALRCGQVTAALLILQHDPPMQSVTYKKLQGAWVCTTLLRMRMVLDSQ